MTKRISTSLCILLTLCVVTCSKEVDKQYGKAITLKDTLAVTELLQNPEVYVGQEVLISGNILDVCPKKGCWIDVAAGSSSDRIQVKVKDDEIVFPLSARGKFAVVQGTVERLDLTKEQVIAWKRHEAEERGEPFDPLTVAAEATIYRIRGNGAVISE
ncbi:MAG: DUF4920 domain-containing protein [bacterium]